MKTFEEIKKNPKLEIIRTGIDGGSGILHMTGLRHCTIIWSFGGGGGNMFQFALEIDFQNGMKCVRLRICSGMMMSALYSITHQNLNM